MLIAVVMTMTAVVPLMTTVVLIVALLRVAVAPVFNPAMPIFVMPVDDSLVNIAADNNTLMAVGSRTYAMRRAALVLQPGMAVVASIKLLRLRKLADYQTARQRGTYNPLIHIQLLTR